MMPQDREKEICRACWGEMGYICQECQGWERPAESTMGHRGMSVKYARGHREVWKVPMSRHTVRKHTQTYRGVICTFLSWRLPSLML